MLLRPYVLTYWHKMDSKKKRTTVYLDEELHKRVRLLAIRNSTSMAKIVSTALRRYLAALEEDPRQAKFIHILREAEEK
jgi:predicted transcriptional regulator